MTRQTFSNDCDVVVVNYNAGGLLCESVRSALREGACRVFVVDNGSLDQSLAELETSLPDPRIHVIRNDKNMGFAAACNVGIHASSAEALLFLNPDCALATGSLNRMLEVLESSPTIGMVGAMLCNTDGSEQPGGRRVFPTPWRAFAHAFGLSLLTKCLPLKFPDFLLYREPLPLGPTPVEAISGACMLVKRAALKDVGLWDDGYFLHCEDVDWCMRFQLNNWSVMFVPDAHAIHVWGACSRRRPFFVEWHKHHGMLRFYRKFFKRKYSLGLWWLVNLGVWLRLGLVSALIASQLLTAKVANTFGGSSRV